MPPITKAPCLVWYVDDDTSTASDIIGYWKLVYESGAFPKPRSIQFRHFSTALSAWEALQNEREAPQMVVIDGHLNTDEGEFKDGAYFIQRVRSSSLPEKPVLIAFSGDEYALQDMERAGAEVGFDKGSVRSVIEYIARTCTADGYGRQGVPA